MAAAHTTRQPRLATIDEILPLRCAVLRPGQPLEAARFAGDEDPASHHFGLFEATGHRPLACLSLMRAPLDTCPAWQLRGMAVDPKHQNSGLGRQLLAFAVAWAEARHHEDCTAPDLLWCNARERATPFYTRSGWDVCSEAFDIPGIGLHYRMRRPIAPLP